MTIRMILRTTSLAAIGGLCTLNADAQAPATADTATPQWEQCGWGGGGFYYAAAFHPTRDGVIYMGGDVAGVYKTEDRGRNWRMINNGLANYGIFSLAVDRSNPETVYAATDSGLCKSVNGGEKWELLPLTGPKDLRITGEKGKSIRCIAVDPSDGKVVYAASPAGKVFKSTDGGQTWIAVYVNSVSAGDPARLRVQYGKVTGAYFGGIWMPLKFPAEVGPADAVGFGFNFKGDKSVPRDCFLNLKTREGVSYRSRNLNEIFADDQARDVVLKAADFTVDPEYAGKNPDKLAGLSPTPEWSKVNRLDLTCVGSLPTQASVATFGNFFFAVTKTATDTTGTAEAPILITVRDFVNDKTVQSYGNIRIGSPAANSIYSVAIAPKDPSLVVAATGDAGLVLSRDKGRTWTELETPKKASNACFDPTDSTVIYGTFFGDGVWKSVDQGKTWVSISKGLAEGFEAKEVVVSPANPKNVYMIGAKGWGGTFYFSHDGGESWSSSSTMTRDAIGSPTLPTESTKVALSVPTNLAMNPQKPDELFISANWRSCLSEDGGATWTESDRGADISCITDIRFSGQKTYVTAMDEGTLMSDDNGKRWHQLWPLKWSADLSGHNWRVAVNNIGGVDRVISTASPWDSHANRIVVSDDGGKTFKIVTEGLPDYVPTENTMWGRSYARALAVDPVNPNIVYLGMDGNATAGKSGGGIFKSEDGGHTWKQLPNQPASRRMYYGLAIDPTDTQRVYWGAFGDKGGVYRSDDGGGSWKNVFAGDQYLFNLMTTKDGTVYASGRHLWRSVDRGATWQQVTRFPEKRSIVGIEVHPDDPKTIWISATTWSGEADAAVYKSVDGGATWTDITGKLPYIKPQILRYNPATRELWAGWVGLFKIKQ